MKLNKFCLIALLFVFSGSSFALSSGGWTYENITGTLKATPGCKAKEVASKQASTGYRFKKYTKVLCQGKGYGWSMDSVIDKGELICDKCEDFELEEDASQGEDKYSCYMSEVVVKCRMIERGW